MSLVLQGVTKTFPDVTVFRDLSAVFPAGRVSVLLGPSGSGKTTILNLLSGLLEADAGQVLLGDRSPVEARVSYLFQEPRLLPWLTVEKNLDFVLPPGLPRSRRKELIAARLEEVSLTGAARKYPSELSGGMARRAAMARAFIFESQALLMDEPFQGLDLPLKLSLIRTFETALEANPKTVLFVTHNMEEALLLGDEIFVLSQPPARVCLHLSHPVPRGRRYPGHEGFPELERRIFRALDPGAEPDCGPGSPRTPA